jgi:hypothetical protein
MKDDIKGQHIKDVRAQKTDTSNQDSSHDSECHYGQMAKD